MRPTEAIQNRRSIKRFTAREVTRAEIESLIESATLAPNHRLTQPWRFHVLGAESRRAYGLALGARKAKKLTDPDAARAMCESVGDEYRAMPAIIAVGVMGNENPEIAEEDYAATMMGVANLCIAAVEAGLGTQIRSGAVLNDPAARSAIGAVEGERIVALVSVGEPADVPPAKARQPVANITTWQP
jgi:nitroreductase